MTSTFSTEDLEVLRNRTFDEIVVGDRATIQRTLTAADLQLFAAMSGDIAPAQSDAEPAASTRFHGVIAHGMWGAALISAVLGTRLPGPGTSYAGQTLTFHAPVRVGDTLTVTVTVRFREEATRRLMLDCDCTNQDGVTVISGEATVIAPAERIERPRGTLPQVRISLQHGDDLVRLLQYVRPLGRMKMAVVYPCDAVSLSAALDARAAGLIEPVLIGPRSRLQALAEQSDAKMGEVAIDDVPHAHAAAARAVELALKGEVEGLMKGSLHTDELMAAVVKSALRTDRRMSHCFVMQSPAYPRPFIITDAALNIAPTLRTKGIVSEVAGAADILVVPDLESGNMLAKQLEYLGGAASAGIVVGARVPIVLTSRADPREARIASCGVALVVARRPAHPILAAAPARKEPAEVGLAVSV